jgi:SAM-dependent methyltransferase
MSHDVSDSSDTGYTGRDNLEVMQEAVNYNAWLCSLVTSRAGTTASLLDFGAGSGTFANAFAAYGYRVCCVEPDEVLRQRLAAAGLAALSSAEQLADNSCDFIYSFNVLEHIADDAAAIQRLASALKSGGTLLIYVPAFQWLFSEMDRKVGHVRRYRRAGLKRLIEAGGLRVVSTRYADCLGFLATVAYKILGPRDGSINPRSVRLYDRWMFPLSRRLDRFAGFSVGKNLVAVAIKP